MFFQIPFGETGACLLSTGWVRLAKRSMGLKNFRPVGAWRALTGLRAARKVRFGEGKHCRGRILACRPGGETGVVADETGTSRKDVGG